MKTTPLHHSNKLSSSVACKPQEDGRRTKKTYIVLSFSKGRSPIGRCSRRSTDSSRAVGGVCKRGGKTFRIAAMNINLLAVRFSSSPTNATYGLSIYPHSNPTGLGLNPNDNSEHAYETLEQLWQAIQACELVTVPNIEDLEAKLEQAKIPVPVAQMSEETARQLGFK